MVWNFVQAEPSSILGTASWQERATHDEDFTFLRLVFSSLVAAFAIQDAMALVTSSHLHLLFCRSVGLSWKNMHVAACQFNGIAKPLWGNEPGPWHTWRSSNWDGSHERLCTGKIEKEKTWETAYKWLCTSASAGCCAQLTNKCWLYKYLRILQSNNARTNGFQTKPPKEHSLSKRKMYENLWD